MRGCIQLLREQFVWQAIISAMVVQTSCREPTGGEAVRIVWRIPVSGIDGGWDGVPTVAGGHVLMQIDGDITAMHAATGSTAWKRNIRNVTVSAATNIVAASGRLFTVDKDAVALNGSTGAELWRFAPDSASQSFNAVDDRAFYVGTRGHSVHALDVASGAELWKTDFGPSWTYPGIVTGISVSGDTVYVGAVRFLNQFGGSRSGVIVALNRLTGDTLWTYQSARTYDSVNGPPVVSGNYIVANDLSGGSFFALNRFTGQEVWRVVGPLDRFGAHAPAVVIGQRVYVGSNDEYVYSVDLTTGTQVWKTFVGGSIAGFAVCGDRVYAQSFKLTILDRSSGKKLDNAFTGDSEFLTSGLVSGDRKVFGSGNKAAYAFAC